MNADNRRALERLTLEYLEGVRQFGETGLMPMPANDEIASVCVQHDERCPSPKHLGPCWCEPTISVVYHATPERLTVSTPTLPRAPERQRFATEVVLSGYTPRVWTRLLLAAARRNGLLGGAE